MAPLVDEVSRDACDTANSGTLSFQGLGRATPVNTRSRTKSARLVVVAAVAQSGCPTLIGSGVYGQGAFATVWRATCIAKDEDVAVKIMNLEKVTSTFEEIRVGVTALRHRANLTFAVYPTARSPDDERAAPQQRAHLPLQVTWFRVLTGQAIGHFTACGVVQLCPQRRAMAHNAVDEQRLASVTTSFGGRMH